MTPSDEGKVITARGPVEPDALGRVLMHEHLHADIYDWGRDQPIVEERPITAERRELLMREAVPPLRQCNDHGCFALVDATPPPWRAWPTFYVEASEAANFHVILSTGFYREVEEGTYWVKKPEYAIWPFVREAPVEQLAEMCTREITEGIHRTGVRAGAIKLGTSAPELTEAETKAFRAGARAQRQTGVHITTHCTQLGAETTQLALLDAEGVDLSRVVIGHTGWHLMDPDCRQVCLDWMRRGANFAPTNLRLDADEGPERWRPLVEAIHEVFDAGLGGHLALGLDCAFASESEAFHYCIIPPPPYLYMFTHTLPAFREMGLTAEEEETMMATNPQRILPVRRA
jgi:predicted metal-dependent phosphotriesterase family hydrolase